MGKPRNVSKARHDSGVKISTKSPYGSHAEMVVDHAEYGLSLADGEVLLQCDTHFYITNKKRLDDGLADPARYCGKKLALNKITPD